MAAQTTFDNGDDRVVQETLSQAYAFLGNSLLAPMSQTDAVGLQPEFWEAWPVGGGDAAVVSALQKLVAFAQAADDGDAAEAVQNVSVEYTHLFIGPPHPAAPPWETMNPEGRENTVGFGQATIDMRHLLNEAGLQLGGSSNQYEDHMGVELLYLSTLCANAAQSQDPEAAAEAQRAFIKAHPLAWIGRWRERIEADSPHGYYAGIAELAHALLAWHVGL